MRQSLCFQRLADRPGRLERIARVGAGQDDREFFATVACDQVAFATQAADQYAAYQAQAVVARLMAVVVVVFLEEIHVDQRQRKRLAT
jgi:hypothetical protein